MKNFVYAALLALAISVLPNAIAAEAQQLSPEQEAAVSWVLDNQSTTYELKPATAITIVLAAYYFAQERGLDPHHLLAMMWVESRFNPRALSSEGAKGLMQVIPRWHRQALAHRNPFDPVVSIEVGSSVYHDCLEKSLGNVHKAVSCYSGGATRYYRLVEEQKKKLMHHIVVQLFAPTAEVVASR